MVEANKLSNRQRQILQAKTLLIARAARRAFKQLYATGEANGFLQALLSELKKESIRFRYPSEESKDYPRDAEGVINCFGSVRVIVLPETSKLATLQRAVERTGKKKQESLLLIAYKPNLVIRHVS